jgi:hypothetical protein
MSETSSENHDSGSPLEKIVDDETPKLECSDWAFDEIAAGRLVEEVVADLMANGWSHDDAEEICEDARRRTRAHRGVTTREDVARGYGINDPNVVRNAIPFSRPGMLGHMNVFSALSNLIRAIARYRKIKDVGRRK